MNSKQQNIIDILNRLNPKTVVQLDNVSFQVKALALPGVEAVEYSTGEVSMVGELFPEDPSLIDVSQVMEFKPDSETHMIITDKYIIVGGLNQDDDSSHLDPFDNDGNGEIHHYSDRNRRSRNDERKSFYEALGLDSYGRIDLNHNVIIQALINQTKTKIKGNRSLMTTLSNLLRSKGIDSSWDEVMKWVEKAIHDGGAESAKDYIARYFLDTHYWERLPSNWQDKLTDFDEIFMETEIEKIWKQSCDEGKIGNPLAVKLDIYEHGGVAYSVSGEGMNCAFDTSRCAAIWVPDPCAEENIRCQAYSELDVGIMQASGKSVSNEELLTLMQKISRQYCRSILTDYNNWLNGDVHSFTINVIDRQTGEVMPEHEDSCSGHIGSQYAEQELQSTILQKVLELHPILH